MSETLMNRATGQMTTTLFPLVVLISIRSNDLFTERQILRNFLLCI